MSPLQKCRQADDICLIYPDIWRYMIFT
jgi:hypothetical protein